jgi:hypothetical protein
MTQLPVKRWPRCCCIGLQKKKGGDAPPNKVNCGVVPTLVKSTLSPSIQQRHQSNKHVTNSTAHAMERRSKGHSKNSTEGIERVFCEAFSVHRVGDPKCALDLTEDLIK